MIKRTPATIVLRIGTVRTIVKSSIVTVSSGMVPLVGGVSNGRATPNARTQQSKRETDINMMGERQTTPQSAK